MGRVKRGGMVQESVQPAGSSVRAGLVPTVMMWQGAHLAPGAQAGQLTWVAMVGMEEGSWRTPLMHGRQRAFGGHGAQVRGGMVHTSPLQP